MLESAPLSPHSSWAKNYPGNVILLENGRRTGGNLGLSSTSWDLTLHLAPCHCCPHSLGESKPWCQALHWVGYYTTSTIVEVLQSDRQGVWMHSSKIKEMQKIVNKGSVNHSRPSNVLSLITSSWSKKTNCWSILWGSIVPPSWCDKIYKTLFQPKRLQRTSDPFVLAQSSLLPTGAFWF